MSWFLVVMFGALWLAQQQADAPKVSNVHGSVINVLNGEALENVTVFLRSTDAGKGISYADETDTSGRFEIADIQPGEYTVSADRSGFFLHPDGAPGAPASPLKISIGEQLDSLTIRMMPAGAITGRVLDQDGGPVRGAVVALMQSVYVSGEKRLRQVAQVQAKNNGDYRLFNLHPGTFFILARPPRTAGPRVANLRGDPTSAETFATFFPNSLDAASASPVHLSAGAELHGYDVSMRSGSVHKITVALPADNAGGIERMPAILPRDGEGRGMSVTTSVLGGKMEFSNLLPGAYVILAARRQSGILTYARLDVDLGDADLDAGTLAFEDAREVSAEIKMEGQSQMPPALQLSLQSDGPSSTRTVEGEVQKDGSARIHDIAPAVYRIWFMTPGSQPNFYVKSIRLGDQLLPDRRIDLTKAVTDPLTIVLGTDAGVIEGSVKEISGEPCSRCRLTLFPAGAIAERSDFFKFLFSDDKGNFQFKNVAPGEYQLFAWEDVEEGEPQDSEFRARFEKQSTPVKLVPNGRETLSVTAISAAWSTGDR